MPTLHALLIGIDKYPNPRHQLQGCVRDQLALRQYLQQLAQGAGYKLDLVELMDEAATRAAVIQAFEHFQKAGDDDICLLSYSGHGSRNDAHEAFWHLEPSRFNQSLVLWDSRTEGGRDLMDKELSYLIWKATNGKSAPFVAIMDCCHSGSGTRDSEGMRSRMAEKGNDLRSLEEMEGYSSYEKGNDGSLSPPRGKHILLAAARDNQKANELQLEGETRGVFTFSLIEALRQYGNQLSYSELVNHLRIRIAQRVKEQSPQLESIAGADPNLLFLSRSKTSGRPVYLVSYESAKGWYVNAGAFDGFKGGGGASITQLELEKDSHPIRIVDVYPGYATIEGMPEGTPPESVHRAVVKRWGNGGLKLAISPDSDSSAAGMLRLLFQRTFTDGLLQLVENTAEARFHLQAIDQSLRLILPGEKRPVFRRVPGYQPENGMEFLKRTSLVSRWIQLLELANPQTTIQEEEIKVELFRLSQPGKMADTDPVVPENWRQAPTFRYFYENGKWSRPGLQLRLTNTGTRSLWVSGLYLTGNFGIYNVFLPKQELGPGQEVWMLDVVRNIPHRSIILQLEPEYHSWGVNQVSDFLKILVCSEEFNTDPFNQDGLPLDDRQGGTRGFALWEDLSQTDWLTREIELKVVRPFDPVEIQGGAPTAVLDLKVTAPPKFHALAMLNTLAEATTAFPTPYVLLMEGAEEFGPLDLSPAQQGNLPLCVLEFWDCEGLVPIQLELPANALPSHCDPQTGRFRVLQHEWVDGKLYLKEFPPATPSPYTGLDSTFKVFFRSKKK
ncbi:MAG: caspase family protein [Lewinellaceae bacterium]|nr:caspase family protein [Lewinellaceae bacterium]